MNEKQLLCPHMNFASQVDVVRLTDSGRFTTDIRIKCADCDLPFQFKGLPGGSHPDLPTISADGTEGRFPIAPGVGGWIMPQE